MLGTRQFEAFTVGTWQTSQTSFHLKRIMRRLLHPQLTFPSPSAEPVLHHPSGCPPASRWPPGAWQTPPAWRGAHPPRGRLSRACCSPAGTGTPDGQLKMWKDFKRHIHYPCFHCTIEQVFYNLGPIRCIKKCALNIQYIGSSMKDLVRTTGSSGCEYDLCYLLHRGRTSVLPATLDWKPLWPDGEKFRYFA